MLKFATTILLLCVALDSNATSLTIVTNDRLDIPTSLEKQQPGMNHTVLNLTHPPFVMFDSNWEWKCNLCESIPTLKQATIKKDSQTITYWRSKWKIKDEIFWSNGFPVTGYDIKATLDSLRTHLPILNKAIRSIAVNSRKPRHFEIRWREDNPDFIKLLALRLIPPSKNLEVSYGPYMIKSWQSQKVTLELNPHDKTSARKIENIELLSAKNHNEIPKSPFLVLMRPQNLPELEWAQNISSSPHTTTEVIASNTLKTIFLNLKNPIFNDARIRKALLLSIDREKLNQAAYQGHAFPYTVFSHPADTTCPIASNFAPNIQLANELLDQTGAYKNSSGLRERSNQVLSFQLAYHNNSINRAMVAILETGLQELGIQLIRKPYSLAEFRAEIIPKAKFEHLILLDWKQSPTDLPYGALHSKEVTLKVNRYSGHNISGWVNRHADEILQKFSTEHDIQEKQKLCGQMQHQVLQDVPFIALALNPYFVIYSDTLSGIKPVKHYFDPLLFNRDWSVEPTIAQKQQAKMRRL